MRKNWSSSSPGTSLRLLKTSRTGQMLPTTTQGTLLMVRSLCLIRLRARESEEEAQDDEEMFLRGAGSETEDGEPSLQVPLC